MRSIEYPYAFSGLPWRQALRYSPCAVAQSTAGRRNPCLTMATQHAPSVFFFVAAFARSFFAQWFLCYCGYQTMVAQAGQPSGWPVSIVAGIPTPVWATTIECRNSGGCCYQLTMETAIMATTLTPSHPQFVFLFAAVRRNTNNLQPCMLRTVATCEHAARRALVRDYVLAFAGRLPVAEVA
ncbi:host cell division inhibitor Icd-like protein [Serratia fonticola]|uniref:host cell division inhibitor Icd-like protein n=1 Tax=Serratia fonticola TaxID=47917 RepID=UPI0013780917|nr:host cell division inhibitor Icd-like protein [Serratia fonticola]NBJ35195.1 host cell division inhibitor Icd-like protein [Serratia fonticola]